MIAPIRSTLIVLRYLLHSTFLAPFYSSQYAPLLLILTYPIHLDLIYLMRCASFFSTFLHSNPIYSFPSALSDMIRLSHLCST